MKIAIILGTRPEIIKMAPVVWACRKLDVPFVLVHTGQHYSPNMDSKFIRDMELGSPRYNLRLGGLPFRKQIGLFSRGLEPILGREKPDVVIVQGDTTSVAAGTIAARRLGIRCAHLEAGLRSHDPSMPEENIRIFADHLADILLAPTTLAVKNLRTEGIPRERIHLTGNTIVDALRFHQRRTHAWDGDPRVGRGRLILPILHRLKLDKKRYFVATMHRAENTDNRERLECVLEALRALHAEYPDYDIVYPVHPRARLRIKEYGLHMPTSVTAIEPISYFNMLDLVRHARLVLTDSGGLQEECCILKVPAVTLRDNTERPETVKAGVNILSPGLRPKGIIRNVEKMMNRKFHWINPYGDGHSGERIVRLLSDLK